MYRAMRKLGINDRRELRATRGDAAGRVQSHREAK
jgi:hypothetical protein